MATDPPVSERQRRAMFAALNGNSTLGIPKSVAEKFVGPHAHDMTPQDWNGLYNGLKKFFTEEMREPEHASDEDDKTRGSGVALRDPDGNLLFVKRNGTGDHAGTWAFPGGYARTGESDEAAAIRELEEEIGFLLRQPLKVRFDSPGSDFNFSTFVHDVDCQFDPMLNDESTEFAWRSMDDLPKPLHPGISAALERTDVREMLKRAEDVSVEVPSVPEPSVAGDSKLSKDGMAFDRATVRSVDPDGRLHVEMSNISKANVCPYLGKEIPDWQALGLQPDKIYQLLRDPEELRKAAPTFNNLPLLSQHVPVSAANHQPDLVVGSTGTDAEFSHPYLKNSLVVWAKDAIDAIQSEVQKELSSAYRYRADMTPGTFQGARYDGVMRNIVGNHVALVKEGRAGTDVVVGDSKPAAIAQQQRKIQMTNKKGLSRTAMFVSGALTTFLLPKIAQDAKLPDIAPALADVTAKNFVEMKPKIEEGVKAAMADVALAKDANLDDMHSFIDRLDKANGADEDVDEEEKKGAFDEEQSNGLKAFLKDKLSEDNMKALDAFLAGDEPPAFAGSPVKEGQDEENEQVNKNAMDEAIKVASDDTAKRVRAEQQAIREAERFVRPWVGELAIAYDSAEAVHRAAAKMLNIDGSETVHKDALPALIKAQPLPGKSRQSSPVIAADASLATDFFKSFPMAERIGQLG